MATKDLIKKRLATVASAESHKSSWEEGMEIDLIDEGIEPPIPTTNDNGKIVKVASGKYVLAEESVTAVEANPVDTGTVVLSKLKVGTTTYNIPQTPVNYVTTDTVQTITGWKSFTAPLMIGESSNSAELLFGNENDTVLSIAYQNNDYSLDESIEGYVNSGVIQLDGDNSQLFIGADKYVCFKAENVCLIDQSSELHKVATEDYISGTNDGTNWTTLTIGEDTYNIPSGGGGGSSLYIHCVHTNVGEYEDKSVYLRFISPVSTPCYSKDDILGAITVNDYGYIPFIFANEYKVGVAQVAISFGEIYFYDQSGTESYTMNSGASVSDDVIEL